MAVKKNRKRHRHYAGGRESIPAMAARLSPPEELMDPHMTIGGTISENGLIRVNSSTLKNGKEVSEEEEVGPLIFGIETSVVTIVTLSLAYIAFIAWQISRMP